MFVCQNRELEDRWRAYLLLHQYGRQKQRWIVFTFALLNLLAPKASRFSQSLLQRKDSYFTKEIAFGIEQF